MNLIPELHDGRFDGVWVSPEKNVHVFVRGTDGRRMTIVLTGVKHLKVWDFLLGNIVFDIVLTPMDKVTPEQIEGAVDFELSQTEQQHVYEEVRRMGLSAFELSSSCGATCVALFQDIAVLSGHVLGEARSTI